MSTRVHISLPVTDLDAAIGFYESLLGQPVTKRKPGYANFRLDAPPIHLALTGGDGTTAGGHNHSHFGIELPDRAAFGAWRQRLRDAGVAARDQPDASCCYAKGDKLWLNDPDGNEWEVWVRTGEADRLQDSGGSCCVAA